MSAWNGDLSYSELNAIADRLAHHLIELGVKHKKMIITCFDKSLWAIVAMLAVLKAGAAVVPIGTKEPLQRVQAIIANMQSSIILGQESHIKRISKIAIHAVVVDKELLEGLPLTQGSPRTTVKPHNAVYVIHTSGRTGVPKGVVLEHSALCSSMKAHGNAFAIRHGEDNACSTILFIYL